MHTITLPQNSICSIAHLESWYYAWADNYLRAVICRSLGGLTVNEKEEKKCI